MPLACPALRCNNEDKCVIGLMRTEEAGEGGENTTVKTVKLRECAKELSDHLREISKDNVLPDNSDVQVIEMFPTGVSSCTRDIFNNGLKLFRGESGIYTWEITVLYLNNVHMATKTLLRSKEDENDWIIKAKGTCYCESTIYDMTRTTIREETPELEELADTLM